MRTVFECNIFARAAAPLSPILLTVEYLLVVSLIHCAVFLLHDAVLVTVKIECCDGCVQRKCFAQKARSFIRDFVSFSMCCFICGLRELAADNNV